MTGPEVTATTDTPATSPLWEFATRFWQLPEASELCLQLQDRSWNVTAVLCAGWLALQRRPYLGNQDTASIRQWHDDITSAIRALKKTLDKRDGLTRELRARLAAAELEAERIELWKAWQMLQPRLRQPPDPDPQTLIRRNLLSAAPDEDALTDAELQVVSRLETLFITFAREGVLTP